jgi:DNA-directed RNA polymerase specialized sigma subunit
MDHQEWRERYNRRLRLEEDRYVFNPLNLADDWRLIRLTMIKFAISLLPKAERQVAKLVFFDNLTEQQAARRLGISRIKAHRLKWRAIDKLFSSPLLKFVLPPDKKHLADEF